MQFPGRGTRGDEPSKLRVARIATAAAKATATLTPADVPIVLFGHGLGALCAFEVARRLEGLHGRRLSGCAAPSMWPSNAAQAQMGGASNSRGGYAFTVLARVQAVITLRLVCACGCSLFVSACTCVSCLSKQA